MFKLKIKDPTLKLVLGPTAIIVLISLLFFGLVNYSYPLVEQKLNAIKEAKNLENTLSERVSYLKVFREGVLDDRSDQIYAILPDGNSSALAISQTKNDLSLQGINLESVEVEAEETEAEIDQTQIVYKFSSPDFAKPLSLAITAKDSAPLSTLQSIKIDKEVDGNIRTELITAIYWSDLPTKLPTLTDPITELSTEDQAVLARVLTLRLPSFNNLNPNVDANRRNPFN